MLIPLLRATLRPAILSSFSNAAKVDATEEPVGSPEFWWKLTISMCLVLGGGVFAGYVFIHQSILQAFVPCRGHIMRYLCPQDHSDMAPLDLP